MLSTNVAIHQANFLAPIFPCNSLNISLREMNLTVGETEIHHKKCSSAENPESKRRTKT